MPRNRSTTIRVFVTSYGKDRPLMMRYRDPATGKRIAISSGTYSQKEAEREAAKWEQDINAQRWTPGVKMSWDLFCDRYEKLYLSSLADTTAARNLGVFTMFREFMSPRYLDDVSATVLSEYAAKLRSTPIISPVQKIKKQRSETTIKGHLSVLQAAFRWAVDMTWIVKAPKTPKIERARKRTKQPMKGRPITDAEFLLMLANVEQVIDADRVAGVKRFLWLIRLSGFRLSEALDFWWDNRPEKNHVHIGSNGRPSIVLYAGQQKANEDETLPVTREFGEWLLATPASERVGRVAPLPGKLGNIGMVHASEQICAIGEAAKITVEPRTGKFASSHDIRRLFVTSLLRRFSPAVVQKLARHESIETTMSYYADLSGEVTADLIWNDERATVQATV